MLLTKAFKTQFKTQKNAMIATAEIFTKEMVFI